jgi:hypothetical protein
MVSAYSSDAESGKRDVSFADEIARLTDTITACERLCLLSARTVVKCASQIDGLATADTFIPSISRSLPIENGGERHPTTSAQCVTALQHLLPVIGRFRLGTHASGNLALYPIERAAMNVFKPSRLEDDIREKIERGLRGLHEPMPDKSDDTSRQPLSEDTRKILTSGAFKYLHPITAAYVLRATAPSKGLYGAAWWQSLFIVLWFLNRRGSSRRGYPNIQTTDSPGTAFLTSKCVDAVKQVLDVFGRRRDRFRKIIDAMEKLEDIKVCRSWVNDAAGSSPPLLDKELFSTGFDFQERAIAPQVEWWLQELEADSSFPETYTTWNKELKKLKKTNTDCCRRFIEGFQKAQACDNVKAEHAILKKVTTEAVNNAENICCLVERICRLISCRLNEKRGDSPDPEPITALDFDQNQRQLPDWICSEAYWNWTKLAVCETTNVEPDQRSRSLLEALESHWRRHRDAAREALHTTRLFKSYLDKIVRAYADANKVIDDRPSGSDGADASMAKRASAFILVFRKATTYVSTLREHLQKDVEIGAKWAAILMNRHLRFAASGAMTEFDSCELAHALRVIVCASDHKTDFHTIMTALRAICTAQRADGSWACQQPFYWTKTGLAALTLSIETAGAIVATVNTVQESPERFGASREELSAMLEPVYRALDKSFHWLLTTMHSFSPPAPLMRDNHEKISDQEPPLHGWCSDREFEDGRIHSWVTAAVIEYLVALRQLSQQRINALLRTEFLSYHPDELHTLADVAPTDLDGMFGDTGKKIKAIDMADPVVEKDAPVILRLLALLQGHKQLEFKEGPWLPAKPPRPDISFWSGIFYGPPGTSKTFLAKAIAGELNWPLVSLSPSDFLTRGTGDIEARATEIFSALESGSRMVYLLDETDELIRDRLLAEKERTALSFLTPSFLTKLQDLRDKAKHNEFIFILATNYYDRIDSAAKRTGRIDRDFILVYPDRSSRAAQFLECGLQIKPGKITSLSKSDPTIQFLTHIETCIEGKWPPANDGQRSHFVDDCATFSGPLSYQTIKELFALFLKIKELFALPKPDSTNVDTKLEEFIKHLSKISKTESAEFKPEVKLEAYLGRPGVFDEIKKFARAYPLRSFPPHLPNEEMLKGVAEPPVVGKHISELIEAANKKKDLPDLDDFKKDLEALLIDLKLA